MLVQTQLTNIDPNCPALGAGIGIEMAAFRKPSFPTKYAYSELPHHN
jgi:hypothetical protein